MWKCTDNTCKWSNQELKDHDKATATQKQYIEFQIHFFNVLSGKTQSRRNIYWCWLLCLLQTNFLKLYMTNERLMMHKRMLFFRLIILYLCDLRSDNTVKNKNESKIALSTEQNDYMVLSKN